MSPLHKRIAAAAAVAAAASVWIARFVSDDGADLAATAQSPTADGSLGSDFDGGSQGGSDGGFDGGFDGGDAWIVATEAENGGSGTQDADAALASLGAVLGFLEARERPADAAAHAARALDLPGRDAASHTSQPTDVDVFLAAHPVRALAIGSRRASALLGRTLVHAGDTLAGGSIVVAAIDRDGVVLDTPRGRFLMTPTFVALQPDDAHTTSAQQPD